MVFVLVAFFIARRGWRYFHEVEEDDDFADHLATLAVAHRWVFPVYLALLILVAVTEFFQSGNLFFSLSVLFLASSLRRYFCEGDFADFPRAQKLHLAMRLLLVWLGWAQGYDNYLSDLHTWFHWPVFFWVMLALATLIFNKFYNDYDLAEHRKTLLFFLGGFVVCVILGGTVGYLIWTNGGHKFNPWLYMSVFGILACVPLAAHFSQWLYRILDVRMDRFLFDIIFSHAAFSETVRKQRHLPSLQLLRHWRDRSDVEKAWQTARAHLFKEERALPVWLFAMETAVLYRRQPDDALEILNRLYVTDEFPHDQRVVAVGMMQGWMAAAGFAFDAESFQIERPPLQPAALTNQVEQKCREGRFGAAVMLLNAALEKDGLNEEAFIQLVRLQAQDLKNRRVAEKLIADAADTFSPKLLDFLKRSLDEWMRLPIRSRVKPGRFFGWLRRSPPAEPAEPVSKKIILNPARMTPASPPPEDADPLTVYLDRVKETQGQPPDTTLVRDRVEKLLLERRLGTAVELLQQQAEAEPEILTRGCAMPKPRVSIAATSLPPRKSFSGWSVPEFQESPD